MSKNLMKRVDVSSKPGAFRAARRRHLVTVEFATADGEVETLEGTVRYRAGDALLTGLEGERWPVARESFFARYEPAASTAPGEDGRYRRRPGKVWAWTADMAVDVLLSDGRGRLHAKKGDVLVQFDTGDMAVMPPSIFGKGYVRLAE